ncbi:HepT-like ribonuclease domain-containing protein [Anseongella ginsenosidimutans]|uniref:HepT-like ribonuclease domain-containing protein n=1 Tax=Anseongella ginsenosidimutans TaxID=496056 RepID=UPI001050EF9A|nr:DUF86 domain-containing protein [Anseongella ginsenosidimutans]
MSTCGISRECIQKTFECTNALSEDQFLKSRMVSDAVIRNFEIIGEASRKISPDFKSVTRISNGRKSRV